MKLLQKHKPSWHTKVKWIQFSQCGTQNFTRTYGGTAAGHLWHHFICWWCPCCKKVKGTIYPMTPGLGKEFYSSQVNTLSFTALMMHMPISVQFDILTIPFPPSWTYVKNNLSSLLLDSFKLHCADLLFSFVLYVKTWTFHLIVSDKVWVHIKTWIKFSLS